MPTRPAIPFLAVAIVGGLALTACGGAPTAGDYAERGEEFIADGLDGQADRAGLTFNEPQCEDPPATSPGTTFTCTAQGSDATAYTFTVTIVGRNRMELVSQPALPSPGGDTTAASTTPASAAASVPPTTAGVPATTAGG